MPQLIDRGDGTYAFKSAEALKRFLSINGKCLGEARKGPCQKAKKVDDGMFAKLVDGTGAAGFPSQEAAAVLDRVAGACICGVGHLDAKTQRGRIYNEWNRKLWVAYLEKNGVHPARADGSAPRLEDKLKWKEVLRQLTDSSQAQEGMNPALRAMPKKRLTPIQQAHLIQDKNPPTLIQTRTTRPVGGLA